MRIVLCKGALPLVDTDEFGKSRRGWWTKTDNDSPCFFYGSCRPWVIICLLWNQKAAPLLQETPRLLCWNIGELRSHKNWLRKYPSSKSTPPVNQHTYISPNEFTHLHSSLNKCTHLYTPLPINSHTYTPPSINAHTYTPPPINAHTYTPPPINAHTSINKCTHLVWKQRRNINCP